MQCRIVLWVVFLVASFGNHFTAPTVEAGRGDAYISRGWDYLSKGQPELAAKAFEDAKTLAPDNIRAYIGLGTSYDLLGRYDDAIQVLTQVAKLPVPSGTIPWEHAWAYSLLGDIFRKQGRYEEALAACKQGLEFEPYSGWVHSVLGQIYIEMGDLEAARNEFEILDKVDRELADSLFLAIHEAQQQSLEESKSEEEEAQAKGTQLSPLEVFNLNSSVVWNKEGESGYTLLKVIGEVSNNTGRDLAMVELVATIYKPKDKLVARGEGYVENLASGQTKSFDIQVLDHAGVVKVPYYYEVSVDDFR